MKPLFFIGNKRSGTTRLCLHLSSHPKIFVTNESDVVWLLYQMDTKGVTVEETPVPPESEWGGKRSIKPFERHPLDIGSSGAVHTMRALHGTDILSRSMELRQRFVEIQRAYYNHMLRGKSLSPFAKQIAAFLPKDWDSLSFIGDKMPTQVADPKVFEWVLNAFPDAHFVHIVRHPARVVASMRRLGYNSWWRGDVESVLEQWAEIEEWALEAELQAPCVRVYQEGMAREPDVTVNLVFKALGLSTIQIPRNSWTDESAPVRLPENPRVQRLLELYGYA